MVMHGNRPEVLRDVLVAWMKRHPLAPLENEVILVQSNGIAQWLKLALAMDTQPSGGGGCGIAAALSMSLPSRFQWQAYRAILGRDAVPESSPFDKSLLVWRLMRLLPAQLDDPVFAPLARFLDNDGDLRKRHQLAERLADLFDQYQVYRADWLAAWGRGEDVLIPARGTPHVLPPSQRWQPALWRALLADVGQTQRKESRAAVHERFLARAADPELSPRPEGLPRRVMVFGISSMPRQALEVLAGIARWTQVLMCVHNPCEHYWADIVPDKDLLRPASARHARKAGMPEQIPEEALHLHAHPLLAAWGKQGRDFIALLDEHDSGETREAFRLRETAATQRLDLFESAGTHSLLTQLQDDIRDLRPLAETRARWAAVNARSDGSIRFHIAHGPLREVEILHDQLLAAFNADATLRPRDVIVMVPDIETYVPHVEAVFGLLDPADPRHIPFSVADQGLRRHDPLLNAVEKLLDLPHSRIAVSDVLDLLEVPALRARFGIAEDQIALLHRWIRASGVRWGLHGAHRGSFGLPDTGEQNSWVFGLRRMLLGYAVGAGGDDTWQGIEPLDEIGGLDAALVGPLIAFIQRIEDTWRMLCIPASAGEWSVRLRVLLADFFVPDEGRDAFTLQRLETALQAWEEACADAALEEPLPLSVVREHWLSGIDEPGLSQRFFAGAVTFATLMPMRAIPFRHVCLLGMNDGDYPRTRTPADFDLMGSDYRPGDRSRREDDRYLFLEALLSARECLHVSWVGRSIHDNTERPPSVLVAQLRDHLAAGWRLAQADGEPEARLLDALTVEHRLQPFSRDYFPPPGQENALFTYAREWRAGIDAAMPAQRPHGLLPPLVPNAPLDVRELAEFLRDPVGSFFRRRLGVHFESRDPATEDHEPFVLDGLENWRLQDELIRAQFDAIERGASRTEALSAQLARIARRGELAGGRFADLMRDTLAAPMDDLFARYALVLERWPNGLDEEAVSFAHTLEGQDVDVADIVGGLRRNDEGARVRVMLDSANLVKGSRYRRERLIRPWVYHLAGHLGGEPLTTVVVGKNANATLLPLAVERAREHFGVLVAAWFDGMRRPLPLAPRSALAWLRHVENGGDAERAARVAYDGQADASGEVATSAYLQRAWPDFRALWSGGEFAEWTQRLLQPMCAAIESKTRKPAEKRDAGADA